MVAYLIVHSQLRFVSFHRENESSTLQIPSLRIPQILNRLISKIQDRLTAHRIRNTHG